MMSTRTLVRLVGIQRTLARYGLDDMLATVPQLKPLRVLFFLAPKSSHKNAPRGERIRRALEELGPIFVKFGQALSTRRDLLPPDIAAELAKLQDAVPPFPAEQAIEIIETAYGQSVDEVFEEFDREPLGAASIAQVHAARLKGGKQVIAKVLRPDVEDRINRDLEVMRVFAQLVARYSDIGRRLKPVEVVAEYEQTITDELDLMREAANAAQLRRNFEGTDLLYVPEVYWDYCRPEVMVQERIFGVQISDMDTLRAANTNFQMLAENGVEIFFTQVFRHNFFHADMHPGNIFVMIDDPQKPLYAAVDFGIVGTLNPEDKEYLAANFLAFFDRDYHRIAKLHIDSGWVPEGTRIDQLEAAVRTVCEPVFNKPLEEISFAQVLMRLFRVAQRFEVEIQPQLVLLQKTLFNIEGLGRDLYPRLDLWKTARPVLKKWMDEQVGPRAVLEDLKVNLPQIRQGLRLLPVAVRQIAEQASDGKLALNLESPEMHELRRELERQRRQRFWLILAAVGVLSASLVYTLAENQWLAGGLLAGGLFSIWRGRPGA